MRVLVLTHEPPLDPAKVASGNALRAHQLSTALEGAGHETVTSRLLRRGEAGRHDFRDRDQLAARIRALQPEAILVTYWDLLQLLPFDLDVPVVLDFLAPRPLESLYENPERVTFALRRLRHSLARCDCILVGNEEQEKLLLYWLLEAGFDLRTSSPVRVVPLAASPADGADDRSPPAESQPWTLVGGGVDWPWRRADRHLETLRRLAGERPRELRIVTFGTGVEEAVRDAAPGGGSGDETRPMASYNEYCAFLGSRAHIGFELGEENIERRFSQSFRSLDLLRHGLPLICSPGLPIARWVRDCGAGWIVDDPDDLRAVLDHLGHDPEQWRTASAGAVRLVRERFDPDAATAPLLAWLEEPAPAARLPGWGLPDPAPPVLGRPPWRERITRRYRLARRVALARWLSRDSGSGHRRDSIVIVSRGDLFPTDHGAAVKIVETARALSRTGREVAVVTDDRGHWWRFVDGRERRVPLPAWLRVLARPLPWVKLDHYTRDIPESNAFLYLPLTDGSFFWRVLYVARRIGAGVLQAEFPAYALPCRQVAEVLGATTVLVEHNVEYDRLRRQVPELDDDQFARLRSIEIELCNRSDAVVCVSDNDRQRLAEDGVHPALLHTVPHGIDMERWDAATPADPRDRFPIPQEAAILVYHGTFAYPPNRAALHALAEEILPRLDALGVEAHVLAIGHQPPPELPERIHCTGSVDDVASWLKAADVAIVPLREGGGTRMKIIDYFAAALPVISTAKGIEGIPVVDGAEALVRDDWDQLAIAVRDVLTDRELAERLSRAGRARARALDWNRLARRYLDLYSTITR